MCEMVRKKSASFLKHERKVDIGLWVLVIQEFRNEHFLCYDIYELLPHDCKGMFGFI